MARHRRSATSAAPTRSSATTRRFVAYQLEIEVARRQRVRVGALGLCAFPAGRYVYTGSARRNLEARIARHLSPGKPLRWHIDYLLAAPGAHVVRVRRSAVAECRLSAQTRGAIVVPGFGASDCRAGCGSHLKYRRPARQKR